MSIIQNTKPAVLRNTSKQQFLFINSAIKDCGATVLYSKTYKLERGKDTIVQPNHFLLMRPECLRLQKEGMLAIVRDIDSEVRTDEIFKVDNLQKVPHEPVAFDRTDDDAVYYLRSRLDDPKDPKNDTMWFIDKGTGGHAKHTDIDFRVRLNGQTYSVFDELSGNGVGVSFSITDWFLDGQYWKLNVAHNLAAQAVLLNIYEASHEVFVHQVERIDNNVTQLWVLMKPDLRFSGVCNVWKVI